MFSIPNPTKKIIINFSLEHVKKSILRIPIVSYPKYKLTSTNDIINLITLECFELLSLGVYIDLTLSSIEDNKTEINIEVRRKLGSFDNSIEMQNASEHIINLINLIGSESITMTDEDFCKKYSNTLLILGILTVPIIIGIIILPIGIYAKIKQNNYNKTKYRIY